MIITTFFVLSLVVNPAYTIYMGKDKYESKYSFLLYSYVKA